MALTNFAALNPQQKMVWSRDVWNAARDQMFTKRFIGSGQNAMIQKIDELTRTEKGEQVIMQLVADLVEDGVIGDNEREGNEESMQSYSQVIDIDLLTHSVRNKGKLSDQKTVINFRKQGRDRLAYWLANRVDQLVFLTLAGISYAHHNNGMLRDGSPFPNLAFADDVTPPSAMRHLRWDGSAGELKPGDTTKISADDTLRYGAIVDLCAYSKEHYIKPIMSGGKEYMMALVQPGTLAQLKKDPDYQRAVVNAMPSGKNNPFFTGAVVTVDGLVFHEHRLTYNTKGAPAGEKWGASGNVNGARTSICGAQALGMADLGNPEWTEKMFQYDSQQGINVDKMFGLLKPRFYSIYDQSVEDFGVVNLDHYLQ